MAEEEPRSLYPYSPSNIAAIVGVVVFAIIFVVHVFRLFKTRTWFCIPFIIGAACEFPISPIPSRLLTPYPQSKYWATQRVQRATTIPEPWTPSSSRHF